MNIINYLFRTLYDELFPKNVVIMKRWQPTIFDKIIILLLMAMIPLKKTDVSLKIDFYKIEEKCTYCTLFCYISYDLGTVFRVSFQPKEECYMMYLC